MPKTTSPDTTASTAAASTAPDAAEASAGSGGLYRLVDGKRVLVHRTEPAPIYVPESEDTPPAA